MRSSQISRWLFVVFLALAISTIARADSTVVWISVDGLRHDYIDRAHPPTLERLKSEGAFTNQESPIFPSLTFPNHAAQVTGKLPDQSGVVSNAFWDPDTARSYNLPSVSALFRAEPIWVTAKRQGLRVAVIDWPMSEAQAGPYKSDYFTADAYDTKQTDRQRLEKVAQILKNDHAGKPLRLVITYMANVDHDGHKYGPDAKEIDAALLEADATLGAFIKSAIEWFDSHHPDPQDQLYVLITTDHGMNPVHTLVNLDRLIGAEMAAGAKLIFSGPFANIYLTDVPAEQKAARADQIIAKLKPNEFLQAWKPKDVPAEFHYADPTRVGDVVVLLSPGYTFTSRREAATLPAVSGPLGMHGYDPAILPTLKGSAIVWHYKHPMNGKDLGPIVNTQWHATVAKILGITPAEGSDPRAIDLP